MTGSGVDALGTGDLAGVGIVITIVLVVIGVLLSALITKLLIKAFVLLVVAILAVLVWVERSRVEDRVSSHACKLDTTYFGVTVDPPQSVKQACARRG